MRDDVRRAKYEVRSEDLRLAAVLCQQDDTADFCFLTAVLAGTTMSGVRAVLVPLPSPQAGGRPL